MDLEIVGNFEYLLNASFTVDVLWRKKLDVAEKGVEEMMMMMMVLALTELTSCSLNELNADSCGGRISNVV